MKLTLSLALIFLLLSSVCFSADVPLTGEGLTLPSNFLDEHDIVIAAIGGAIDTDSGPMMKVGRDSKLSYSKKVSGGKVHFEGGIQFSKGAKKFAVNSFTLDIPTGIFTAKFDTGAAVMVGIVNDPHSANASKEASSTELDISFDKGLNFGKGFIAAINDHLGTKVEVDEQGQVVDASVKVSVDLVVGPKINSQLIVALGLDSDIDMSLGVKGLLDLAFDTDIVLF